jgi:hypothetical protein
VLLCGLLAVTAPVGCKKGHRRPPATTQPEETAADPPSDQPSTRPATPEQRFLHWRGIGMDAMDRGDYERTIDAFQKALAIRDDRDVTALLQRARQLQADQASQSDTQPAEPIGYDEPNYPPDESLDTEAYLQAGLPEIDSPWSPKDYNQAALALEKIAAENPLHLPRYRSEQSGAVFARMVDLDNLDPLRESASPVTRRFALFLVYLKGTNQVYQLYISQSNPAHFFGEELVELYRLMLSTAAIGAKLSDEYIQTLPIDDPQSEQRRKGLSRMRHGYAQLVRDGLASTSQTDRFTRASRLRLIGYLHEILPPLMPHLAPVDAQEIVQSLELTRDTSREPAVKEALTTLYKDIEAYRLAQ